jgi:Putative transmembrane protein (Alph_Pro_TM)
VFACRDGAVVGRASRVLPVVKAGLPAQIGAFAFSHPTAYGALAVLAAAMTGLAMDALVRRRRPYRVGRGPRMPPPPTPPPPAAAAAPETDEEAVGVGEAESSRRG